jgi:fructokinase
MLPDGKQLGGAPANFAYHANALGADGIVASCVGDDPLGREIREVLQVNGLSVDYVALDPSRPTGTVTVSVSEGGQPDYTIHEDVAWDFIPFTPELEALAARADAVCFGSLASRNPHSRETIRRFLGATMPGCLRVLDVNLRQQYYTGERIESLLEHADVLKLNEDELPEITSLLNIGGSAKERMERLLQQFALQTIALTRGARGSILLTPGIMDVHHGLRIGEIADTVGAGDSYTAVLVMGLLRKWTLEEINERANQLAGHVCGHHGAMAPHPEDFHFVS